MSVTITNVSDPVDIDGKNHYVIKVGNEYIATFTHVRRDGLAVCLRRAANAVRAALEAKP